MANLSCFLEIATCRLPCFQTIVISAILLGATVKQLIDNRGLQVLFLQKRTAFTNPLQLQLPKP